MDIRHTPLPARLDYLLDGAIQGNEIDNCTNNTLRLYGDPERLDVIGGKPMTARQMFERMRDNELVPTHTTAAMNRAYRAAQMMCYADEILPQLDEPRRGALIYDGLRGIKFQIKSIAEVLSDWAMTDTIEGGALENFKRGNEIRLDRRSNPYKRTLRMLCSPTFIRRYIVKSRSEEIFTLRNSTAIQIARLKTTPSAYIQRDDTIWADFDSQLQAFKAHRRLQFAEEERQLWRPENFGGGGGGGGGGWDECVTYIPKQKKINDLKRRKLLKRASKMASSVLGVQAVNALARGEKIKIEGPTLALQMQKLGLLTDTGHSTLDISMLDNAGQRLADLCIYQDDIPAIDQAVGFALMVQSGMEKELLGEANIIRTTPAGEENVFIMERQRQAMEIRGTTLRNTTLRGRWTYEQHEAWRLRYWGMTKEHWLDIVAISVLGKNKKMLQGMGHV